MEKQEHTIQIDQRVRLKGEGQDDLYVAACAGSEGWVRKHSEDHGFPMVYVEWDKDHWAYNGEPDRWAFEAHFDPIGEQMSSEEDFKLFQEFQEFQNAQKDKEPEPANVEEARPGHLTSEQYEEMVEQAAAIAQSADAFILIAVDKQPADDHPVPKFIPAAITAYKSPESGYIAELQLSKFASLALEELTVEAVRRAIEDES